ncbi:MAG TPA: ABC transporter ATP-binding protein [Pseudothermotoga sp.]|nr:ABC transporter ATP-binding protein [Pseudothermotoga sp.]HOK84464.1 ABC transporter ATP-binding protein [Pseudothermotoga sp.]HPP70934.1 ABC transporter ATP-binding protein [Pseudothermotoga sp.]
MRRVLELSNVCKDFGRLKVLKDITLDLYEGQSVAIVGKSGCGKTTLLRIIASLESPTCGEIKRGFHSIGYVFQEDRLIPWCTALENLLFVCEDMQKAVDALRLVELEEFKDYKPRKLSGGMRQRLNLARAMVRTPDLLLLDEPFQSLDLVTKSKLITDLQQILNRISTTCVVVTHDIREAVCLSRKIYVLAGHPATIVGQIELERQIKDLFDPQILKIEERLTVLQQGD